MTTERITEITAVCGGRVDTTRGVVFGVRVLGAESRNGRTYTTACLRDAVPHYEAAKVFVDHTDGGRRTRSYRDEIGMLRKARFAGGSIRADLHLNMAHEVAGQVLHDAQHSPDACGLSHDVEAKASRGAGGRVLVEKITRVRSVDLVVNPATVAGLFESQGDDVDHEARILRLAQEAGLPKWSAATIAQSMPSLRDGRSDAEIVAVLAGFKEATTSPTRPKLTAIDRGIFDDAPDIDAQTSMRRALGLPNPAEAKAFARRYTQVPGLHLPPSKNGTTHSH